MPKLVNPESCWDNFCKEKNIQPDELVSNTQFLTDFLHCAEETQESEFADANVSNVSVPTPML